MKGSVECARTNNDADSRLSKTAMKKLDRKSLSRWFFPPEETFVCWVIAKYLLYYFTTKDERRNWSVTKFMVTNAMGESILPLLPWSPSNNETLTQNDLDFYFKWSGIVGQKYAEDNNKTTEEQKFLYNDFWEQLAVDPVAGASATDSAGAGVDDADALPLNDPPGTNCNVPMWTVWDNSITPTEV
jgi:hypothetical protein